MDTTKLYAPGFANRLLIGCIVFALVGIAIAASGRPRAAVEHVPPPIIILATRAPVVQIAPKERPAAPTATPVPPTAEPAPVQVQAAPQVEAWHPPMAAPEQDGWEGVPFVLPENEWHPPMALPEPCGEGWHPPMVCE